MIYLFLFSSRYSPISSEEAVKEMYQKCLETRKTK